MSVDEATTPKASAYGECRILTISTSSSNATSFINRVKSLSKEVIPSDEVDSTAPQPGSRQSIVPYTLRNRYYTADVHFAIHELKAISPELFSPANSLDYKTPPAVIFVWTDGEPYAKHVEDLSRMMALREYEPEVCLAVRIPATISVSPPEELGKAPEIATGKGESTKEDENEDIDSTLMSFGFEYVDATVDAVAGKSSRTEAADEVPHLPRVLDALSTIMWPSMESASSLKSKTTAKPNAKRDAERDAIMEELLAVSGISGISAADSRSRLEHDPTAEDDDDEDDSYFSPYDFNSNSSLHLASGGSSSNLRSSRPWLGINSDIQANASGSGSETKTKADPEIVQSPTDIEGNAASTTILTPFGATVPRFIDQSETTPEKKSQVSIGFEDDFTVFVSAAPPTTAETSAWTPLPAQSQPDANPSGSGLTPSSAARLGERGYLAYRSLGSVSDFGSENGEHELEYSALGDDENEDTHEEVEHGEWEDADEWADHGDFEDLSHEEEEDGMPTKEEIMRTAAQIFGGAFPPGGAGFKKASALGKDRQQEQLNLKKDEEPSQPADDKVLLERMRQLGGVAAAAPVHSNSAFDGANHEDVGGYDSDEDDIFSGPDGNIDIERVLFGLQAMRNEIAGVQDEDQRRRMAARVALGFVYGMDIPSGAADGGKVEKK